MIVRGAAGRKIPHSRVFAGEHLYFMEKGSAEIATNKMYHFYSSSIIGTIHI